MKRLLWLALTTALWAQGGMMPGPGVKAYSAASPCTSVLATDNFNRANENPIGGNWTSPITGFDNMLLTTNQVVPGSSSSDAGVYYNAVTPNNNQCASAIVTPGSDTTVGGGTGPGPAVRAGTAAQSGYFVYVNKAATQNVALTKWVSGTPTNLWTRTASCSTTCTVQIRANGTTIQVFVGGSQVGADTIDSGLASGRCGLGFSSTTTGAQLDDFECDNY